jgi:hypothetical protein
MTAQVSDTINMDVTSDCVATTSSAQLEPSDQVVTAASAEQQRSAMDTSRQWAKKRRRPTGLGHVRTDAAAKISDVAEAQTTYYNALLQMAHEKHDAEMELIKLKQMLIYKKLSKVSEE